MIKIEAKLQNPKATQKFIQNRLKRHYTGKSSLEVLDEALERLHKVILKRIKTNSIGEKKTPLTPFSRAVRRLYGVRRTMPLYDSGQLASTMKIYGKRLIKGSSVVASGMVGLKGDPQISRGSYSIRAKKLIDKMEKGYSYELTLKQRKFYGYVLSKMPGYNRDSYKGSTKRDVTIVVPPRPIFEAVDNYLKTNRSKFASKFHHIFVGRG